MEKVLKDRYLLMLEKKKKKKSESNLSRSLSA